ncbi:MAG: hypothetical protein EOP83_21195 [Verrucomicrobiaceae bacterium]|nr:MAG: hypothetical protein EOP83_21195 [Verrucomicrobiaceae bacterium]
MHSMRDIMTLMEGPRKKPAAFPVVNTEEMLGKVMSLQSILQGMHFEFNAEWVNGAIKEVNAKKLSFERQMAEERERHPEDFDPNMFQFDPKETFREIIPVVVERNSYQHLIYSEVTTEERVYQDSMNTDPDDLSDFVEDSDFLRCLQAQRDFGTAMSQTVIGKPSTYEPMIAAAYRILDTFKSFDPNHQQVEPKFVGSVQNELEHMIPLLRFMLKNNI